ncbi:restriction endonuclease subunit S [Porphyromonas gingivalis]|uniref:restriction endonuclease subunit S n=1 Tax=Porphyromonas gingivalis TaxID=837 RepID=UPI001F27CB66|nr:restriction endonuclease subunit S [Porphyromonas gingivalis]MCE8172940.1 restriction endonuclease subunit S [Porphyromonas gingivalis]MCE8176624.1 restriction endonuclease subunit S [Porphyromonas gingivalis]
MRFPEFADEWKQTTLGEILAFETGYPFPSDSFNGEGNGVRLIKNRDLKTDDRIIYYEGEYDERYIVQNGDILIGMDGDFSPCLWKKGKALLNQRVGRINTNQNASRVFILYVLADSLKEIELKTSSTTVKHLSHKDVEKIKASLPSLAEQQKIAGFLSLIDERIQSCSETIKEIKTLKAGLLSLRVYQADKQYVPLSYFGEMKHGYPFKSTSYDEDGTHRIVTISNVSGARYADMSKCNYLAELPHDIQQHQILSRNDILISLTGNVGRVSFCLADGDLLNQRVGVLSLCDEAYKEYIYQVLSDWRFEMSMVACGQGAAQLNISKSNVEGYLVPYEQSEYQEIGNFFSLLDDRIEIEEALLKQYEMQKKYLLRQMFI